MAVEMVGRLDSRKVAPTAAKMVAPKVATLGGGSAEPTVASLAATRVGRTVVTMVVWTADNLAVD